jgi:hypothetical protein
MAAENFFAGFLLAGVHLTLHKNEKWHCVSPVRDYFGLFFFCCRT